MRKACEVLDTEFLLLRHRILDVAAGLDRVERAEDAASALDDPRMQFIKNALSVLQERRADRAERIQMVFSREYDPDWQGK